MASARPPRRRAAPAGGVPRQSAGGTVTARPLVTLGSGRSRAGAESPAAAVRRVLRSGGPAMVFQPQLCLTRLQVTGYEALARFPGEAVAEPEHWFGLARESGLGPALEARALANALSARDAQPAGTTMAINVSPGALGSAALQAALPADLSGIEIELTEHDPAVEAQQLRRELDPLRERGARLAIDDVGTAYSGLCRVADLAPDSLKLDRHLVRGVAGDPARGALIRAVVGYADDIGATVCAEGVESVADLVALADLGVDHAQGWAIGAPEPTYTDATPAALAEGRRGLQRALTTAAEPAGSPPRMEGVLVRLAEAAGLPGLAHRVHEVATVLGCARTELAWVVEESRQQMVTDPALPGRLRGPLSDYPDWLRSVQGRLAVPVTAIGAPPAERAVLGQLGHAGVLLVPVISRGRTVGLLECYRDEDRVWSRRQIRSAQVLACGIGPVLDALLPGLHPVA